MFNIKKNQNKEEQKTMTLEEIRKAFESLSDEDKQAFEDSINAEDNAEDAAQEGTTEAPAEPQEGEVETPANNENAVPKKAVEQADMQKDGLPATAQKPQGEDLMTQIIARVEKLEQLEALKQKQVIKADEEEVGQLNEYEARWNN